MISASTDLLCLINQLYPDIILLQETWLNPVKNYHLNNFRAFRLDRPSLGGGLIILVSNKFCRTASIAFQLMSTDCEILAIDLCLPGHHPFSLINAYFPTGLHNTQQLDTALANCKNDFLLTGDFNSHHVSWGFRTDPSGTLLWDWMINKNLTCLNDRQPTFIRGRTRSVLDLTFCSPSVSIKSWKTIDFSSNSDHLPVYFEISCAVKSIERTEKTLINYKKFKDCLRSNIRAVSSGQNEDLGRNLCSALKISKNTSEFVIASSSSKSAQPSRWWNDECTRDYRRRKAAWKRLICNQSPKNWKDYQFIAATFKRTVSRAKEQYDQEHFEYLSKSNNKRALFNFLRGRKKTPIPGNVDSVVYTSQELQESLNQLAKELENRFSTHLPNSAYTTTIYDYTEISTSELNQAMERLPNAAPGPDGITNTMLKILHREYPNDLLGLVNYSLRRAWIPSEWKIAKIIPLLKKQGAGYNLDNIRPIALTSNVVKLIERVLHGRIIRFINEKQLLSSSQIGFRSGYSIWHAHVDLESRIHIARHKKHFAALVTLDICKAYDSVEYSILTNQLWSHGLPPYIVAWVTEFLSRREFYCYQGGFSSCKHKQTRGVPQGSVLSPVLFNILLSTIPVHPEVKTYVYADDIAFFAMAHDFHCLYTILQTYLNKIEHWLDGLMLNLNTGKCAILVFPIKDPVHISINYKLQDIPQVQSLKYLGVMYNEHLNWRPHIEYIATKAVRAMGVLRRLSNCRSGMRRKALLIIYKMYVRPVLEFGCILFSGAPAYKLRPLVLLEREALRLCLGLPKYTANAVLYLEARIPTLLCRFNILTVQTFLRLYEAPFNPEQIIFISNPDLFFSVHWPRFTKPQIVFVQSLLEPLNVHVRDLIPLTEQQNSPEIVYHDIFPTHAKLLPTGILNGLLQDHLSTLPTNVIIATDASQSHEKSGVGIYCPVLDWSFSLRLPDFLPVFLAEFMAIMLALRKVNISIPVVAVITDSLSVCSSLSASGHSPIVKLFKSLIPCHLRSIHLIWTPGHKGLLLNEIADSLAKASLSTPIIPIFPHTVYITVARFRTLKIRQNLSDPALTASPEYKHLLFPWRSELTNSRMMEVVITKFRCRVTSLNFYLHRSGILNSPMCIYCNQEETISHFLLHCRRFDLFRQSILAPPLQRLGLQLSQPDLLSFGASTLGFSHRDVLFAVQEYITATKRFSC